VKDMGISQYEIDLREKYIKMAKSAAFQDAVFLISYYNNHVKNIGPKPRLDNIEPKEIFKQFDNTDFNNAMLNAGRLLYQTTYVGTAFFNYPGSQTYESALVRMKNENPGFSENCYDLVVSMNIKAMR
jgi:hypothetical protein